MDDFYITLFAVSLIFVIVVTVMFCSALMQSITAMVEWPMVFMGSLAFVFSAALAYVIWFWKNQDKLGD